MYLNLNLTFAILSISSVALAFEHVSNLRNRELGEESSSLKNCYFMDMDTGDMLDLSEGGEIEGSAIDRYTIICDTDEKVDEVTYFYNKQEVASWGMPGHFDYLETSWPMGSEEDGVAWLAEPGTKSVTVVGLSQGRVAMLATIDITIEFVEGIHLLRSEKDEETSGVHLLRSEKDEETSGIHLLGSEQDEETSGIHLLGSEKDEETSVGHHGRSLADTIIIVKCRRCTVIIVNN